MVRLKCLACLMLGVLVLNGRFAPPAEGQEWTRFRGPNGSGIGNAPDLPATFAESDFLWRIKLPGVGHSSPVLWGNRLFLTSGQEETGRRVVSCLDTADGRVLWERDYTAARHGKHALNSFASATPVVDADRLYVSWATPDEFIVLALDHRGNELWRSDLGPFKAGHGYGVSSIVHDDLLIVPNEQEGQSFLAALEVRTGQIRWRIDRDSKVTYTTPCVYAPPGRPAELIFTNWTYGVSALDPATGRTQWELDIFDKNHTETAIGSPIVAGDLALATCGWLGYGNEVIAVRGPTSGGPSQAARPAERVYRISRSAPLCTTPVVKGDLLFLWADEGIVTCADVRTGQVHWQKRVGGTYYSSPVCAGDRIYNIAVDGQMHVLEAAAEFRELAKNDLGEGSHSTPAIAHGRMYVRTFTQLMCLSGPVRTESE